VEYEGQRSGAMLPHPFTRLRYFSIGTALNVWTIRALFRAAELRRRPWARGQLRSPAQP
jgi:hypothetical protein